MAERTKITTGMQVFDRAGEPVGKVDRIYREREDSSLHSETYRGEPRYGAGILEVGDRTEQIEKTLYVPMSEIMSVDARGVYLNAHKDAVDNRHWNIRPVVLDEPRWEASL